MMRDLRAVAGRFAIPGAFLAGAPYGSGHINDTYAVRFDQAGAEIRYIFQRINGNVFPDIPALMENVERVTAHLAAGLAAKATPDRSRRTLTLVPTREGAGFLQDEGGDFWRAYLFIEKARTYDQLTDPSQAYQAARAFGAFQRQLTDLPGGPLNETIRGFHDGPARFAAFQDVLDEDPENRALEAKAEIEFLTRHAGLFEVLPGLVREGRIPVRSTHNDCKINNVMIDDATGEGISVIDLDTLMPGLALFDFGDMVRTSTCRAAEDERDLTKVVMDPAMFEQVLEGYLSTAGGFLNRDEIDHLPFAGKLITLIIGTRFLTDHLAGDRYFKIHRPGHNLDRCRTQFKLVESIAGQEEALMTLTEEATR